MSATGEHCRDGSESQRIFRISDSCFYPAHLSHTVFFKNRKPESQFQSGFPAFCQVRIPLPTENTSTMLPESA